MRQNALRGGVEIDRYYDIITGNVAQKAEESAESVKGKILAEFERLGGGMYGN